MKNIFIRLLNWTDLEKLAKLYIFLKTEEDAPIYLNKCMHFCY